jgi:hypothetical protein
VTIVHAPNGPERHHIVGVLAEMRERGAPVIRAWWNGDAWIALEGSHRLAAAHELGLTPEIVPMAEHERIDHDFEDLADFSVRAVVEYLTASNLGPAYRFDGLERGR